MTSFLKPFCVILLLEVLSFLTSYFVTQDAVSGWYQDIRKSSLNPPDAVFGPVWMMLYAMLGVALWRLWRVRHDVAGRWALVFFLLQLAGNYSWSFVFFGMRAFGAAFGLLLVIDVLTVCCMAAAWRADRRVVWLMAPYLAWILFATWLTYAVMTLN